MTAAVRVLIVSPFFPPKQSSGSLRAHAFARQFAQDNHDVTVLTTPKADRHATMPMPITGVDVREIDFTPPRFLDRLRTAAPTTPHADHTKSTPQPAQPSAIQRLRTTTGIFAGSRLPDLTHWWIKPATRWAIAHAKDHTPWDLVLSSSGPYTAHLVAGNIKRSKAANIWLSDYRDLWTDNPIHAGLPIIRIYERALERRCLRTTDAITTVCPPLAQSLRARSSAPVEVIFNGYDDQAARHTHTTPPSDSPLRIVHTGTIYEPWQQPRVLTDAIKLLIDNHQPVELHIAGDSDRAWQAAARTSGISQHLVSHGHLTRDQALELQATAHALIVLGFSGGAWPSIPAKLFEYLPKHAHILAIGGDRSDDPIANILTQTNRGTRLPADPAATANALAKLPPPTPTDPNAINVYSRARQSRKLTELCRQLVASRDEMNCPTTTQKPDDKLNNDMAHN